MAEHIAENKAYYDERFGHLSQTLNEEEKRRWETIAQILQQLNLPKTAALADFGCGRGWLTNQLSAFGVATGFDLSQKAVDNAAASFKQCAFHCLNAEGAVPAQFENKFDLVLSSEVIEHTLAQEQYLKNCGALLKAGGHLLLTTPNGLWKDAFYQNGREAWKQPIENWLRPETLSALLTANGFEVTQQSSFNAEWIFDFKPRQFTMLSHPLSRKLLKLSGRYQARIADLNAENKGLNLAVVAKKL